MAVFFRAYWEERKPIEIEIKLLKLKLRISIQLNETLLIKINNKQIGFRQKSKSILGQLQKLPLPNAPFAEINLRETKFLIGTKEFEHQLINNLLNSGFVIIFALIKNTIGAVLNENASNLTLFNNLPKTSIYAQVHIKLYISSIILYFFKILASRRNKNGLKF